MESLVVDRDTRQCVVVAAAAVGAAAGADSGGESLIVGDSQVALAVMMSALETLTSSTIAEPRLVMKNLMTEPEISWGARATENSRTEWKFSPRHHSSAKQLGLRHPSKQS